MGVAFSFPSVLEYVFFFISATEMLALSYMDGWSVIYGLGPLIPDPLMTVVN